MFQDTLPQAAGRVRLLAVLLVNRLLEGPCRQDEGRDEARSGLNVAGRSAASRQ